MLDRFSWRSYDLTSTLHQQWQEDILIVAKDATSKILRPRSVTSREGDRNLKIRVQTTNGKVVRERLPWLYELYHGVFRDLGQLGVHEPLVTATNDLYGAVLNVQEGSDMRYEAHVDSNPVEGLFYVTDHPKDNGGELVVSNRPDANSVAEIDSDCTIVYPVAGHLIFFDGRRFPHYVRSLNDPTAIRVVVAMNFYTPSCPESSRPADLDQHLFGYADDD